MPAPDSFPIMPKALSGEAIPSPYDNEARMLELKREMEKSKAEVASFDARAYLEMPETLKADAKRWGMEHFMQAVWLNAFRCGYLQARRDQAEEPSDER